MKPSPPEPEVRGVSLREAFVYWLRLGFVSFGGPAGQIAMMHNDLVERRRWISERRFLHALNYCMLLPGPEAQQLVTYIGWLMHRSWGGIVAGLLFVLPSLLLMTGLGWLYLVWGDVPLVAGLFYGVKPAVVAIVLFAAWRLGARVLKNPALWLIAGGAFVGLALLGLPFPLIVLGAALAGWLGARRRPDWFAASAAHGASTAAPDARRYLIDDDTPTPAHARFSRGRMAMVIAVGVGLWLASMAALIAFAGTDSTLTHMGGFFSIAALLTFGGAYAVLPFVYQGAVQTYGWVTPTQMVDGLALGESTPGPLIMVVAFIAFLGGWQHAALGAEAPWLGGVIAAVAVTWFTFLPSFVFILAGGPVVEATHGQLRFTAPLTGITAAVVGVILNLALFFAWHVLWPEGVDAGWWAGLDLGSAVLAAGALLALWRWPQRVITVLAASALLGLALHLQA